MEGQPKQADKLNVIWIFAFTLMGGAFVYASFVFLQALYLDEATALQEKREAEGKRDAFNALVVEQSISEYKKVTDKDGNATIQIPLARSMELVVQDVRKGNPGNLVMAAGTSDQPTVPAVFGRPPDNVQMPAPEPPPVPTPVPGAPGTPGTPGDGTVEAPPEGPEGPVPGAGTPTPAPGAGTPAPGANPAPRPGGPAPKPGATPAPRPGGAAGTPAPKPGAGAPAPRPGGTAPAPRAAQPAGGNANP